MYKLKTTRKAIVAATPKKCLFAAGYCELQNLFYSVSPVAYTCGRDGWNYDVSNVNNLVICTGYRGMPGRDLIRADEYENRAHKIVHAKCIEENERRAQLDELLREFCALQLAQN